MDTVRESEVRTLIDANAIRAAEAVADGDRWYAVFDIGTGRKVLASHRRRRREYRDLTRLISLLRDFGIGKVQVDSTHYSGQRSMV